MSVVDFAADDLFIFRTYKHHLENPWHVWCNTYEAVARVPGVDSDLEAMATTLAAFEALIHSDKTVIERVVIATWVPDSHPYDPTAFVTLGYNYLGERNTENEQLVDLETVLSVRRQAASGRQGRGFYRNCLLESDISTSAGRAFIVPGTPLWDIGNEATLSGLTAYYDGATDPAPLMLCLKGATVGSAVRPVRSLMSHGVARLPLDHRYFNRNQAGT